MDASFPPPDETGKFMEIWEFSGFSYLWIAANGHLEG